MVWTGEGGVPAFQSGAHPWRSWLKPFINKWGSSSPRLAPHLTGGPASHWWLHRVVRLTWSTDQDVNG